MVKRFWGQGPGLEQPRNAVLEKLYKYELPAWRAERRVPLTDCSGWSRLLLRVASVGACVLLRFELGAWFSAPLAVWLRG